nr:MAG TPA: hypothetical protein [Caudoviricetes sp.]
MISLLLYKILRMKKCICSPSIAIYYNEIRLLIKNNPPYL